MATKRKKRSLSAAGAPVTIETAQRCRDREGKLTVCPTKLQKKNKPRKL